MNKLFKNPNLIYIALGVILLIHALLLTKLIYFPYPELFIYPYLTNHGLKPYSQILDQHFPGLMFLPINLDNLGMTTPQVARVWSIAIVLLIHILLFFIGGKILKSKSKTLLINFLYLIWHPFFEGWVLWIDNFLPLLLLPAFYFLYKKQVFITGLLLGAAIIFKQTVIPTTLLVLIYLFWTTRSIKLILRFSLGVAIPVGLMIIYLISSGVFKDFWYWTVVFNLTTYAQFGTKAPPSIGFLTRVLLVYGTSILALFNRDRKVIYLLFIFIIGSLVGAFERGDFVHFQPSLPFVVFATVIGFAAIWKMKVGKLAIVGYLLVTFWWLTIFYKGHLGDRVIAFDDATYKVADKIKDYTTPGEEIFVFGGEPQLYQMTNTLPAGKVFVFQFPWFFKVTEGRILEGIIKAKPDIVVSDRTVVIEGQKITEYGKEIDQYINKNYQKIDSIGTTEILRRKS